MALYAGLDLHSRNTYLGVLDHKFKRKFNKRLNNDLAFILATLDPFREELQGIVCGIHFQLVLACGWIIKDAGAIKTFIWPTLVPSSNMKG